TRPATPATPRRRPPTPAPDREHGARRSGARARPAPGVNPRRPRCRRRTTLHSCSQDLVGVRLPRCKVASRAIRPHRIMEAPDEIVFDDRCLLLRIERVELSIRRGQLVLRTLAVVTVRFRVAV